MIEVLDPGLLLTIQDLGRPGFAHLGVPASGAADRESLIAANSLLGNPRGSAAFETTLTGADLRFHSDAVLAVTGAEASVLVDGEAAAFGTPLSISAGSVASIGAARSCVRSYIAVQGGISTTLVLGSVASDLLTGLGSAPLGRGDIVELAERAVGQLDRNVLVPVAAPDVLELERGPRSSSPDGADLYAAVLNRRWIVSPHSNRVGLRIAPAGGSFELVDSASLDRSEPMPAGAVQVPPGGEPIVMLRDQPVTGGYPVVAVLTPESIDLAARLRPGVEFAFVGKP